MTKSKKKSVPRESFVYPPWPDNEWECAVDIHTCYILKFYGVK